MLVSEHSGMSCSHCDIDGRDVCSLCFLKYCAVDNGLSLDSIDILSLFLGCSSNSNNKDLHVSLDE